MCEPATIGYGIAAVAGAVIGAKAVKSAIPKQQAATGTGTAADPTTPPPPTPVTPPPVSVSAVTPKQASRAPNVQALRQANAGGTAGRNASSASTLLTGPSGVDLSQMSIGRNTLLGS